MKAFLALIATASIAQAGYAQTSDTQSGAGNQDRPPVPTVAVSSGSGTGIGISIPQISAKSEVAGESVKLTIGKTSELFEQAAIHSIALSVTAPFNKDRGEGFLLTDSGLPTTLSTDVSYSWSFLPKFNSVKASLQPVSDTVDREIRARCDQKYRVVADLPNQPIAQCNKNFSEIVADLRKEDKKGDMIGGSAIDDATAIALNRDDNAVLARYDQNALDRIAAMSSLSYHALSLNGSVGGDSYKFRDAITLGELKRKQTLFSFGAAYAYIPNISRPWGYFFGGEYRRKYNLPDAETRCPPMVVGANSTTCVTSAFAPPQRNTDATAFAAIRYDASVGKKDTPLAFELKLAYDAEDDEWGVSLPVYFVQDDKGKLNGGVKFGWDSEKDDFTIGFFIGTNFDILKI